MPARCGTAGSTSGGSVVGRRRREGRDGWSCSTVWPGSMSAGSASTSSAVDSTDGMGPVLGEIQVLRSAFRPVAISRTAFGSKLRRSRHPCTTLRRLTIHRDRPGPIVRSMVADRRCIVAGFRPRHQTMWAAAALITIVGAAVPVAQASGATPTQTSAATASASPTPDDRSPTPATEAPRQATEAPRPGDTSPALTPPATPTATTAASLTPTGAPPSTPSERPTPNGSPTSAPAQPESPPTQRPATPPASSTGAVPLTSVLIALAVLVLVSLVLLRLARKGESRVARPEHSSATKRN